MENSKGKTKFFKNWFKSFQHPSNRSYSSSSSYQSALTSFTRNSLEKENSEKTKNSEEMIYENFDQAISNWKLPALPVTEIYSNGTFEEQNDYHIKTVEKIVSLSGGKQTIKVLDRRIIEQVRTKYNYLHIRLIQVGIKPLFRLGLNVAVCAYVRDQRHDEFDDSLYAMIESSLCHGPVYFNCFPNITIDAHDDDILDCATIGFQSK